MKTSTQNSSLHMHPGISSAERERQIALFAQGVSPTKLVRPCTLGDGILVLKQADRWAQEYQETQVDVLKFVPASGAASRMFKHVFAYPDNATDPLIRELKVRFRELPFFPLVREMMEQQGKPLDEWMNTGKWEDIFDVMIGPEGLGYGRLPKGLVHFHSNEQGVLTAFEEHLFEALEYARKNGRVRIHFTVASEHQDAITAHVAKRAETLHERADFDLTYSVQYPRTDTVCVDLNHELVTDESGAPFYRPGGHGALIHNLNEVEADVVFIKNIDNVQPATRRSEAVTYKQALGGYLLHVKRLFDDALRQLDAELPSSEVTDILHQMGYETASMDMRAIRKALDRPIRVCGMVRNEGEPGGGPFWVADSEGRISPQIVEKAQINLEDETQASFVTRATHFNPVDLVCAYKRFDGSAYNLHDFVDADTSFISQKSIGGRPVKALEHPGLWNGAMAGWNTIFIEVPASSFSPVKTVNDLLRREHQA